MESERHDTATCIRTWASISSLLMGEASQLRVIGGHDAASSAAVHIISQTTSW